MGDFAFVGKTEVIPIVEIMASTAETTDRQRLLAERFAEALAIFHTADWVKAALAFEELQKEFPEDGPTRFYIARCKAYLGGTTQPPGQSARDQDGAKLTQG